jgi:hypothetical protein
MSRAADRQVIDSVIFCCSAEFSAASTQCQQNACRPTSVNDAIEQQTTNLGVGGSNPSGRATLADRLATHLRKMASGEISESTMLRCMTLLRELLEERSERQKYPAVALFCDWLLHAKLDRSGGGLLDIVDASWANSTEVDKQIGELVQAFSPRALRDEIVQLLGSAFLDPSVFLNARSCVEFRRHLTADLRDKPIVRRATSLEGADVNAPGSGSPVHRRSDLVSPE